MLRATTATSNSQDDDGNIDVPTEEYWWNDFGVNDGVKEGLFISAMSLGALCGSHLVLFHFAHLNISLNLR